VEGVRLHVRDEGHGPALLMIHGLGGQMAHFNYGAVRELSRRYRVVAIDRPGSGYSTRPEGISADLSTQARAIAALIRQLELQQPTVAGHSLGGATALTLAFEHPQLVGAPALVAPLTHALELVPSAFRALTTENGWLPRQFLASSADLQAVAGHMRGWNNATANCACRYGCCSAARTPSSTGAPMARRWSTRFRELSWNW
jgi:pimeloyl-ACP methyl ester carboxylesterase